LIDKKPFPALNFNENHENSIKLNKAMITVPTKERGIYHFQITEPIEGNHETHKRPAQKRTAQGKAP